MENTDNKRKFNRRFFLETGALGGIGLALDLALGETRNADDEAEPEMVRLLTADGKVVVVDKKHIPQTCGRPVAVSNRELQEWMKDKK
ncbi:MAG: hypothetical protein KDC61_14020 [Saprospiraceae bacterium]|nr:hypothetical protein [Saprospiraceae bacterium]